jgi:hypothetical protein
MTATITLAQLRKIPACSIERDHFEALFGEAVTLTSREHAIALATQHALDFLWSGVARRLLADAALAEYERITSPAKADYERIADAQWDDYERITDIAWENYQRIRARTFAILYYDQETA